MFINICKIQHLFGGGLKVSISKYQINKIKSETDICDTFCCYENCEQCVEKYLKSLEGRN